MCSSLLGCTFSHYTLTHLGFNMFALYSLSHSLESILGAEQFLAFYLTSGFLSSYFTNHVNILTKRIVPSLGASGAICACVS